MTAKKMLKVLADGGYPARIVPVSRLEDIKRNVEGLREQGLLDPLLHETYLKGYSYQPPKEMPDARYIIILSVPTPQIEVRFHWKGREVKTIVPPTYANALSIVAKAKETLERSVEQGKGRFVLALFPYKTLAVRTGLASYGRNNISYVGKQGSFHRLTAFFTNLELGVDDWGERSVLPRCTKCTVCLKSCPTNAIDEDRFLLHAERCLTFLNEFPSDRPFPSSIRPSMHNAIVGCMRCQHVCPYNKEVRDWTVEGEEFSEKETGYLLKGEFVGDEAKEMETKLGMSGLDLSVFPRNLRALLDV